MFKGFQNTNRGISFNSFPSMIFPSSTYEFLLDRYTGSYRAYSIRLLKSTYTGPCIKVRRSSDNVEQDFYFTNKYIVDTESIKSFVGSNSAAIIKWYDQSGNGIDLIQATNANQPLIIDSGIFQNSGNYPSIRFVRSSSNSLSCSASTSGTNRLILSVQQHISLNSFGIIWSSSVNNFGFHSSSTSYYFFDGATKAFTPNFSGNNQFLFSLNKTEAKIDKSYATSSITTTSGLSNLILGSVEGGNYYNGLISEFIVYDSDKSSEYLSIITNINNFYKIF